MPDIRESSEIEWFNRKHKDMLQGLKNLISSFHFSIISRVFLYVSFPKTLCTHILELFFQNLSSRILYCERCFVCDHWITKFVFVIIGSPSYISFFTLCLALCLPSCVEIWELELCISYLYFCNSSVEVPLWKVLGGHSENLFVWRRGRRAVARTSKHILVFVFGSFSLNSLYLALLLLLIHIHARYCLWLKLVFNQESY